jgi:O-antigen ligase
MVPDSAESAALPARLRTIDTVLVLAVFALLPTAGLVNGPIYAPLLFGMAVLRLIIWRQLPRFDPVLTALAAGFALLCWASCLWSIVPGHSVAGAAQTMAVLAGGLILLGGPAPPARLPGVMAGAILAGAALMVADRLTGNRFLHVFTHHVGATKYNRGIDYLLILLMPLLGVLVAERRWRLVALLAFAAACVVAAGKNTTAYVSLPMAVLVLALAWRAPRLVPRLIGGGLAFGALLLPLALRALSGVRATFAPHIKESMLRRLEIWDYVSARVTERPLFGWGIWSAKSLPISSEELSHYVREHGQGIYPHNQWLELWVETGFFGVLFGVGFVLLVLWRVRHLAPPLQPFAFAAVVLALMVSLTSFEVTTDSWWAALAACGFLFAAFDKHHAVGRESAAPPATTAEMTAPLSAHG